MGNMTDAIQGKSDEEKLVELRRSALTSYNLPQQTPQVYAPVPSKEESAAQAKARALEWQKKTLSPKTAVEKDATIPSESAPPTTEITPPPTPAPMEKPVKDEVGVPKISLDVKGMEREKAAITPSYVANTILQLPEKDRALWANENQELPNLKEKLDNVKEIYDQQVDKLGKQRAISSMFALLGHIAVGLYGAKHGVDTSGAKFDAYDWAAEYQKISDNYKFSRDIETSNYEALATRRQKLTDLIERTQARTIEGVEQRYKEDVTARRADAELQLSAKRLGLELDFKKESRDSATLAKNLSKVDSQEKSFNTWFTSSTKSLQDERLPVDKQKERAESLAQTLGPHSGIQDFKSWYELPENKRLKDKLRSGYSEETNRGYVDYVSKSLGQIRDAKLQELQDLRKGLLGGSTPQQTGYTRQQIIDFGAAKGMNEAESLVEAQKKGLKIID